MAGAAVFTFILYIIESTVYIFENPLWGETEQLRRSPDMKKNPDTFVTSTVPSPPGPIQEQNLRWFK